MAVPAVHVVDQSFDAGPVAWAVIAAWALLGYAILARIASRKEL